MPIDIKNVFYTYSSKTPFQTDALFDINLHIEDGDFVSLIGHTGSGKSTLAQLINGLLIPTSGFLNIDNFYLSNKKRKNKNLHFLRKHVGLVFQFPEYQLFEDTVEKDVAFGPKNFKISEKEALQLAHKALKEVGINESYFKRSPFELSGGEKRRVAIAGILALQPKILILDEPTAGLDPKGSKMIMELVKKMNEQGTTIILITHDMDLVLKYSKRCIVLDNGRVINDSTPKRLFSTLGEDSNIVIPELYSFIFKLNSKGFDIDSSCISTIEDLVPFIKRKCNRGN